MRYGEWKPYVSVAARREKARKAAEKAKKAGAAHSPIEPYRGALAKTFWGKAWCDNLEHYSDYANRLPRGRTYVRNGSVIDLTITEGEVCALVMGSRLYTVEVQVTPVGDAQWHSIGVDCSGSIDSLVELLQGKLSNAVMERICRPGTGLFPAPGDIHFSCSCPDWASMCKHVAATLYGVGARLDQQPELLFRLRGVDAAELVVQASTDLPKAKKGPASKKRLDDSLLADVFGIDLVDAPPAAYVKKDAKPDGKRATTQGDKKRSIPRTPQSTSTEPAKKPSKTAKPVKASASSREATAKPRSRQVRRRRAASAPEVEPAQHEKPKSG